MKGRSHRTRKNGSTKSKGGRRQKDYDGHSTPGQNFNDSKPSSWQAREYTSQSRLGSGKHGVPISIEGDKGSM